MGRCFLRCITAYIKPSIHPQTPTTELDFTALSARREVLNTGKKAIILHQYFGTLVFDCRPSSENGWARGISSYFTSRKI